MQKEQVLAIGVVIIFLGIVGYVLFTSQNKEDTSLSSQEAS